MWPLTFFNPAQQDVALAQEDTSSSLPFHFSPSSLLSLIPTRLHAPLRSLLISSLKLGPLPSHISFIMDGNRRYSKTKALPIKVGHQEGFEALKRVLNFLLKLQIKCVTVYAFSIENFNRPPEEVDQLMMMARNRELLDRHGVQIRILGRRDLLPQDVQEACRKAEELTKNNTKGILNFCCPYTSQEEITSSIRRISESTPPCSITPTTLSESLYTSTSPPLDLLLRTSNVSRLSDFLLYQSNEDTVLRFIEPNWPEIGIVDVLGMVLVYQSEEIGRRIKKRVWG